MSEGTTNTYKKAPAYELVKNEAGTWIKYQGNNLGPFEAVVAELNWLRESLDATREALDSIYYGVGESVGRARTTAITALRDTTSNPNR